MSVSLRRPGRLLACAVAVLLLAAASWTAVRPSRGPAQTLSVLEGAGWHVWWDARRPPAAWTGGAPVLERAVTWSAVRPGLERGEVLLAGTGLAWRVRVILVRFDPTRFAVRVTEAKRAGGHQGAWAVDSVPDGTALALNAGQFAGGSPWGWVVRSGREVQPPGSGPLSMAVVVFDDGRIDLVEADRIEDVRHGGRVVEAFQSYPAVLTGEGTVPAPLLAPGRGVDLAHRDTRLGLGILEDGRIIVALTRYATAGDVLADLPIGPTTPEMAAILGGLGCRRAVLLDGGLSAQLLVRGEDGATEAWRAWRRVPLALVAEPR